MFSTFTTQYLPPLLLTIMVALAATIALYVLSRRGIGVRIWNTAVKVRSGLIFLFVVILFIVAFSTFLVRSAQVNVIRTYETSALRSPSNLISVGLLALNPITNSAYPAQPSILQNRDASYAEDLSAVLEPGVVASTNVIPVRAGDTMRYSLLATNVVTAMANATFGDVQPRLVWFNAALNSTGYADRAVIKTEPMLLREPLEPPADLRGFYSEVFTVPEGATAMQIEFRNVGNVRVHLWNLKLSAVGVYIEQHPDAASGSLAYSFDWESAMGGLIHSRGDEVHDLARAEERGMQMREGADWLNSLFISRGISATFYANGYNLLDGNTEQRTFNGDPTYDWANPENRWSDYWTTHPWFSDDPFGTFATHPAWYFGDQTRRLVSAGHEIASHTFAHIYVRGAEPEELAMDADEWIAQASNMGIAAPTTFAFPWRSSNSLTKEFYDVLAERGVKAVTRIYPLDMRDLYTLGNAVVYTDITQAQLYPDMAVMPDFLLGLPSTSAGEGETGSAITREEGLAVVAEVVVRRGTTSFWQHPEQLAGDPQFSEVRRAWTDVVEEAARQRDNGRLWIATVAEITAYQRDLRSVTVTLQPPTSGSKWRIEITNNAGKELQGVTLTLPGEVGTAQASAGQIRSVARDNTTRLSEPGRFEGPARQIVMSTLAEGTMTIEIEWVGGQEPPR